jgi:O-antigen/teichoic acid export membrane protein
LRDHGHSPNVGQSVQGGFGRISGGNALIRIMIYFTNFGLSKAAAYLAPLLLATRLDTSSYGIIEYAWSWSALVATLLTIGIPAAIPQLSLLRRSLPVADIITLCVVGPGAVLTTAAAIAAFALHAPTQAVVLSACTIALAQIALTSYTRTFSHRNLAPWFESISICGMAVISLCLALIGLSGIAPLGAASAVVSALVVVSALALFARVKGAELKNRIQSAVRIGLPLLTFTLASIWATVSGRIYVGAFLSIEDLSIYSVDFRVASALLIVHSVVATGLFARLYRMRSRSYDRFISYYLAAIAIIAAAMITAFPLMVGYIHFRSIAAEHMQAMVSLFPVLMLQVYAWGAWASLELRLARTRRSAPAALRAVLLMAGIATLVVALGALGMLSLRLCAILIALQMLGGVAIQFSTLWRRGAKMPRSATAVAFGAALISVVGWFIQPQ